MKELFSPEGLAAIKAVDFAATLFAFDFDGTLAPIVADPAAACMTEETAGQLRKFSEAAAVAVISGRGASDLRNKLGFEPAYLVGNHGLEGPGSKLELLESARRACRTWLGELRARKWEQGIEIEDKNFSLALHYRRAKDADAAKRELALAVAGLSPAPRVIEGKSVLNLVPASAPDKGSALLELLERSGLERAFFIGDDDTDEDVFRIAAREPRLLTVRVGSAGESGAAFYISQQEQIGRLLSLLLSLLGREI